MAASPGSITPSLLRERFRTGDEIAVIDPREEGSFNERHLLMASCVPLSRLELIAPGLLPRRSWSATMVEIWLSARRCG